MLKNVVKVLGAGSLGCICIIIGNHYYVHSSWQSQHPLIQESINLILKDPKVVSQLGTDIERNGGVTGVLEPDKKWASANFKVKGEMDATVSLVADAKEESEIGDEYYPIESPPRVYSTFDVIYDYFSAAKTVEAKYRWRIV